MIIALPGGCCGSCCLCVGASITSAIYKGPNSSVDVIDLVMPDRTIEARTFRSNGSMSRQRARHEIATAFNLRGRGPIVLSSCSHRGVINVIRQAQKTSGVNKVHAVIGGFHLAAYKEDYVCETVRAIKDMDIDYVIPLHCTGEPFYEMAKAEIPNKLLRSYTGTRFVFSAA